MLYKPPYIDIYVQINSEKRTGSFKMRLAVSKPEVDRFNNFKYLWFSESICSHYIYIHKCIQTHTKIIILYLFAFIISIDTKATEAVDGEYIVNFN